MLTCVWFETWISTIPLLFDSMASKRAARVSGLIRLDSRLSDFKLWLFSRAKFRVEAAKSLT